MRVQIRNISALGSLADRLNEPSPRVLAQTVNRVMGPERTKVRRAVADTTGAPYQRVVKVIRSEMATPGRLSYKIEVTDDFLPLSVFGARETRKGVSAAPWKVRRVFPSTFMVAGQAYHREGAARLPIAKLWGPNVAREMTRDNGTPVEVWRVGVGTLADRIVAELARRVLVGK